MEFAGAFKNPPTGWTTSPTLKRGAVGLTVGRKLIVGTDASGAWSEVKDGWTVMGNNARLFDPIEVLERRKF